MAKHRIKLTDKERADLAHIIRHRSSKSAQVRCSYLLLAADEQGDKRWTDERIGSAYGASVSTIERLRRRFVEEGFDTALHGKKREPLREKLLDGRAEAALIALRCSDPPQGHRQWSLRLLADRMVALEHVPHMSHESVRQLLKKTSSSPGR
ncbi:helix-turn-helix domain-containing protein [Pontibacter sp. E15-1]|uniref:helix-turn-helix domain-containing protein n=1 Tax=Pontibacter sp. E15-1 TaxID=2919918 RepID=UPI001F500D67|nr:helix-turn-helix domain-containing protein [Pontibacter sp. E15-1]MCJ8165963.1 helix-turn-helix domain-containing protein [Pontibacter sp. E15-1]